MNIENMCTFDKKTYTATLTLPEMKNAEPIKIPIFITTNGSYNIFEIKNIEKYDGKIYISEYLKNKYSGPNIEYYETNVPTSINRALNFYTPTYEEISQKMRCGHFKEDSLNLLFTIINKDLEYLKEKIFLSECSKKKIIDQIKNSGNVGYIEKMVASMELDEKIIKPNLKQLNLNKFKCFPEFCLEIEKKYLNIRDQMFSKEYWDIRRKELYLDSKMSVRYYEKI